MLHLLLQSIMYLKENLNIFNEWVIMKHSEVSERLSVSLSVCFVQLCLCNHKRQGETTFFHP